LSKSTNNDLSNRLETTRTPDLITKDWVRRRTNQLITNALQSDGSTLVESPPAAGKTTELFATIEDTGTAVSYLTQRKDLYRQAGDLAREHGLTPKVLPSPHRTCPTFEGDHGDDIRNRVRRLYGPNVGGAALHRHMDLPCTDEGSCPYQKAWEFDPEDYDVLVGHYSHAHVSTVVENRTVVIDEFNEDAAITTFHDPEPVVSSFVSGERGLPYDDWTDFVEHRTEQRNKAVSWFIDNYDFKNPAAEDIISSDDDDMHGLAGDLLLGLLFAEDMGNGFRSSERHIQRGQAGFVPMRQTEMRRRIAPPCVWDKERSKAFLLKPPNFEDSNGVVALDGTPIPEMWNTAFGESFEHVRAVPEARMNEYLTDALDIHVHQYGAHDDDKAGTRPYSSGNHLYTETDERLLFALGMHFGDDPDVITTKKAIDTYERDGVLDYAGEYRNFAEVKSSNDFRESTLGAVLGSPHPGDETFQRWAALMGYGIKSKGRGTSKSYGHIGDKIHRHYVHNQILQSILRFGRDGQEAHVLVTSMATPEWVEPEPLELRTFNQSERAIITALRNSDGMSQGEIVDETGLSQQLVSKALTGFDRDDCLGIGGTDESGNLRRTWDGV
jgi:hypothetical protein